MGQGDDPSPLPLIGSFPPAGRQPAAARGARGRLANQHPETSRLVHPLARHHATRLRPPVGLAHDRMPRRQTDTRIAAAERAGVKPLSAPAATGARTEHRSCRRCSQYRKCFRAVREALPARDPTSRPGTRRTTRSSRRGNKPRRRRGTPRAPHGLPPVHLSSPRRARQAGTCSAGSRLQALRCRRSRIWGLHNTRTRTTRRDTTRQFLKGRGGQGLADQDRLHPAAQPSPGSRGKGRRHTKAGPGSPRKRVFKIASRTADPAHPPRRGNADRRARWDSAFLNADGTRRPAYGASGAVFADRRPRAAPRTARRNASPSPSPAPHTPLQAVSPPKAAAPRPRRRPLSRNRARLRRR